MHDAGGVCARERLGSLDGIFDRCVRYQTTCRNQLVQGLAGDVLHNNEVNAILRTDVMNNTDIGMLQRRDRFRFLLEARMEVWVGRQMSWQDFNRHRTL